jgi:hypothetical protein
VGDTAKESNLVRERHDRSRRADATRPGCMGSEARMRMMKRWTLTGVVVATAVSVPASAAPSPALTGSHESVTLEELNGTSLSLSPKGSASERFAFLLPEGVTQGPDTWYLLRMNVTVTFGSSGGHGSVLVGASTNGRAAAQVEFYPERNRSGRSRVSWDTADLIHGAYDGRAGGRSARVEFVNYLQFKGVMGGANTLTFEAETFGRTDVQDIEIGPASGVYATPIGPPGLVMEANFSDDELRVGEPGALEVKVSNLHGRPVKDVVVELQPRSPHLFTKGPVSAAIPRVDGTAVRRFQLGTTQPGSIRVMALAEHRSGANAQAVATAVTSEREALGTGWRLGLAAALTGALLTGFAIWQRGGRPR